MAGGSIGHVLIVVQNMPVPLDRRVWSECRTLVEAGYRVSVVCPKGPGDPAHERLDGVDLHKYRPPPTARGVLGYALEFAWCWVLTARRVLRIHRRDPVTVLQSCNPPDTYWLLARLLGAGTAFVFDHHDLCPELYRSRGSSARPSIERALRWLERSTYRTADLVLTTNESYRRLACERTGRRVDDVVVVRSGPDPALMRAVAPDARRRRGRPHLVAYLGLMGPQDGVDVVVRVADHVAHRLHRDDVGFVLLGYGDCLEEVRRLAVELDVADRVEFTGRVELPEITAWLSTATLGLSPDPSTPFNDVSTMNKTLEYMAFELPVVAFALPETMISAGPAGAYVPPTGDREADVAAMAEAVVGLVDDPVRRAAMGRVGRERVEQQLGWPASAPQYLAAIDAAHGIRTWPEPIPVPVPVSTGSGGGAGGR